MKILIRQIRNTVLLSACFFWMWTNPALLKAQTAAQYIFSASQEPFSYLAGGTPVPAIQVYSNGISPAIPIGFTFNFAGINYTDIVASTDGWISFNTNNTGPTQYANSQSNLYDISPGVFPFWDHLSAINFNNQSVVIGAASYLTTGTAPNRVFTFEWKDWLWQSGDSTLSFQVKLYETTNRIQFTYKTVGDNVTFPSASASIGVSTNTSDFLSLTDPFTLPLALTSIFTDNIYTKPTTGQVYNFDVPILCSGTPAAGNIAFPSPSDICSSGPALTLIDTGYSAFSGLSFQWQSSANSGGTWSNITGGTNYYYQANVTSNIQYRVRLSCGASPQYAYTSPLVLNIVGTQVYNSIPYYQGFEHWQSYCGNNDVPGHGWVNTPSIGNNSWRRDDQGVLGSWSFVYGIMGSIDINNGLYPISGVGDSHSARFHASGAIPDTSNANSNIGNLDLFLDCSAQTGDKGLYFYYINRPLQFQQLGPSDSLLVYLSSNGGSSFTRIATLDTGDWSKYYLPISSNASNTVVRFQGKNENIFSSFPTDIGIDSVYVTAPCSGTPSAGAISPQGPINICPGNNLELKCQGATMAGNLSYDWQVSDNGGTNWSSLPGSNNLSLKIQGVYDTAQYRLKVTCNSSGVVAYSNIVMVNVQTPSGTYASLPFIDDFEYWTNQCDSNDVPGVPGEVHWTNIPSYGDGTFTGELKYGSWRREDQGSSAGWLTPSHQIYNPKSVHGFHSARFCTQNVAIGRMDLLLDCSSLGAKELQFYLSMINVQQPSAYNIFDSLKIYLSTDGGMSFSQIQSYGNNSGWEFKKINFNSTSPHTIIRFLADANSGTTRTILMDYLHVLTKCAGQPNAGTVDSLSPCSGQDFFLSLSGATESSDLNYQWQQSNNGSVWSPILGGTTPIMQASTSTNKWYRCIVTCNNSGLRDTTPSKYIELAPFYLCYCNDQLSNQYTAVSYPYQNIGNVLIQDSTTQAIVLDNGSINPLYNNYDIIQYSDYRYLMPAILYRDTSYYLRLTETLGFPNQGSYGNAGLDVYVDYNRDGAYDPLSERLFHGSSYGGGTSYQADSGYIKIPVNAQPGLTGMRIKLCSGYGDPNFSLPEPPPCDAVEGEVEDYVVKIEYAPCQGVLNAGTSKISDSVVLNGGLIELYNGTHDNPISLQASQIDWVWQASQDSINWADIVSTEMQDTIEQMSFSKTWYRLKMICSNSGDTSYSNIVSVDVFATNVDSIAGIKSLEFYPNPTEGNLTLKYLGVQQKYMKLTLTDVTGRQLLEKEYTGIDREFNASFSLERYPKGIYIIRTDFDKGHFNNRIILR